MKAWVLLCGLLLCSLAVQAAYVTDVQKVGLYADQSLQGKPQRLLANGVPVEVLQRDKGVVEVRLGDGAHGWLDAAHVTEQTPASARLLQAQTEIRALQEKLAAAGQVSGQAPTPDQAALPDAQSLQLQEQLKKAEARIAQLQQSQLALQQARQQIEQLKVYRARLEQVRKALGMQEGGTIAPATAGFNLGNYTPWLIGFGALLGGFIVGVAFIDYRIRKRYGGFRI